MSLFVPNDCYWRADDGRLMSSATLGLINDQDAAFKAWLDAGGIVRRWPEDASGAQTDASLQDVLTPYGIHYVQAVPEVISDRQFAEQAAIAGLITQDEALAWVGPGTIPAEMLALVGGLPAGSQFPAKMMLAGATTFDRTHPLVAELATAFGWSTDQLNAFWSAAAAL